MCDVLGDVERLGKLKGKREGLLEGKRKGKREGQWKEKLSIAKNMLKKGLSLSLIQEVTGLQLPEIEKLKSSL